MSAKVGQLSAKAKPRPLLGDQTDSSRRALPRSAPTKPRPLPGDQTDSSRRALPRSAPTKRRRARRGQTDSSRRALGQSDDSIAADARLEGRLRERACRVTSQRILVYRALCERQAHLTAEQVLAAVQGTLPKISLPTIYATLELLEEIGLVRRLSAGTGALLFESRVARHSHAVCRSCGSVLDIDEPPSANAALVSAAAAGFAPEEAQVLVTGLCQACRRLRSIDSDITATSGSSSSIPQRMQSAS
ncbi:MAG: Fur family transcriptional regulator [Solirubrobacteraceae bacterium]